MGANVPIKLLDEQRSTICGVRVDLHNYITDERTKKEIEDKLGQIKINVKYEIPVKPDFEKREYTI